jgi:hypothetical protein
LAFLPLHAAGIYPANEKDKVICLADYAISSYTPTLTALAESQKSNRDMERPVKILTVIQPDTPEAQFLPGTMEELAIIQRHVAEHEMLTSLVRTEATVEKVLSEMNKCS